MYKGKENLRRDGENVEYTPEMIEEVMRCAEDPIYFAETYFTIIHPDRGQELIKLYEFQKKMLKVFVNPPDSRPFSIINIPRQYGKTTLTTIYLLWYALFNKDKTIAIIANKEDTAKEILRRVKLAYENLPLWIQVGIKDEGWGEKKVFLGNGSRLIAASTSPASISGLSVSLLFIDEFAKIPKQVAEEFITATYPVISAGKKSKIIIVSTPTGRNHFYEFWSKAVRGLNNFYPIKISWKDHPERDEEWKKKTIADIGIVRWKQEYGCQFLGTSNTLVDSDYLEMMDFDEPIDTKWSGLLSIFKHPKPLSKYIVACDVSKGTGRDYSVIQVLEYKSQCQFEQVAVYRNNMIRPRDFAQVVVSVSNMYNGAYIMVENNDVGSLVANEIWYTYECDRLLNLDPKGLGIRSTKQTKLRANMLLKEYLEKGYLVLHDKRTIDEIGMYEEVSDSLKNNVYAVLNDHDDCVTSLLWALYFVLTDYFDGEIVVEGMEKKFRVNEEGSLKDDDDDEDDEDGSGPVMVFDE